MRSGYRWPFPRAAMACAVVVLLLGLLPAEAPGEEICKEPSADPAGCQPSTFDAPIGQIPSTRVNRLGEVDRFSSDEEAMAGAFHLERKLGLFRNFGRLHWVPTLPSVVDQATGAKSGGDLDGDGRMPRGLGIAGNCVYVGQGNGPGLARGIGIFMIQPNPERDAPVPVGEIAAIVEANVGFDDRELRALLYTDTRMLLVRDATTATQGKMEIFGINPQTCLPERKSNAYTFGGQSHEFYLWHDPKNPNRILVAMAMFDGAGRPDPNNPGGRIPDAVVFAITDEATGEVLADPQILATFTLQEVGGPPRDEGPDATGLFSDGRFADFSNLTDSYGSPARRQTQQNNALHSLSVSDDGERIYVAGGTAGFYILNSEAIARSRDADLIAGTAGCNKRSTNVFVSGAIGGDIDATKLPQVANDCLHMVVNDDPGLKAFLASAASDQAKVTRYLVLMNRSRLDVHPPIVTSTGIHSAVPVPNRPSLARGNAKGRPAFVVISDEKGICPADGVRLVAVDSEATPVMIGAFTVPLVQLENCLGQANTEPNGEPRRRRNMFVHNPTVFENLLFITWFGQGLRAIDISQPQMPREVGYAVTAPHGQAHTYPVFKDGLIYWVDDNTGLHVAKYTGPRASELPGPGSGVVEGNASSPHR
jgi:hypothetical protein